MKFFRIHKIIIVLFFLALSMGPAFSKSGSSHAKDMAAVLGLYSYDNHQKESKENLNGLMPLLDLINQMIDDTHTEEFLANHEEKYSSWGELYPDFHPNSYYTIGENKKLYHLLQDDFGFGWGEYGHRLMFHWGFEEKTNINSGSLETALEQSLKTELSKREFNKLKNQLIDTIYEIQKDRMNTMREAVAVFFNLEKLKDVSRGIAAILYYVHLLGDHVEHANDKTAEAVLSPNLILKAIDGTYLKLLDPKNNDSQGKKARNDLQSLKTEMKALKSSNLDDTKYAEKMLDLLIRYLPSTMRYWIEQSCKTRNYKYW